MYFTITQFGKIQPSHRSPFHLGIGAPPTELPLRNNKMKQQFNWHGKQISRTATLSIIHIYFKISKRHVYKYMDVKSIDLAGQVGSSTSFATFNSDNVF